MKTKLIILSALTLFCLVFAGCTPNDNDKTVTKVTITPESLTLDIGEKRTLSAQVLPRDADDTTVSWSSDKPTVASVHPETGEVTGVSAGEATIIATSNDSGRKANCPVTVNAGSEPELDVLTQIPDPVFLAYCRERMTDWDADDDEKLSTAEAAAVTSIDISHLYNYTGDKTASLEGIEYFTGLTDLRFSYNSVTEVDLSANTALTRLECGNNQLSELIVSANTALTRLDCTGNQLTGLDVSANTSLMTLFCGDNGLTGLNLSANTALIDLACNDNPLGSLDVSALTALNYLDCADTGLSELNLSTNIELETALHCDGNSLTTLDVSNSPKLRELVCDGNLLTEIDLSGCDVLYNFYCNGNRLTSLDVSECSSLMYLYCYENLLTSLDISANESLEVLDCHTNPGDGESKFYVKALFDDDSIPTGGNYFFTTGDWDFDGKTIAIVYHTGDTPPDGDGVVINGITWATRNVDEPGKFATEPEDAGMYYLWNRRIGWSSTNPLTSSPVGEEWESRGDIPQDNPNVDPPMSSYWKGENDPCPAGWRVPTVDEFRALVATSNVKREWIPLVGEKFTDKTSGKSLILPVAGYRSRINILDVGSAGNYWTETRVNSFNCWYVLITGSSAPLVGSAHPSFCISVRCVAE